jgi:hypothetical protein
MNWNDYEAVWKRQELPVGAAADLATLKQTFEVKRRKQAGTLFARDIVEASAGFIASGFFAYKGWLMGKAAWPIAVAVALILGVSVFFIRERLRARRTRLGVDAPLLAKLDADIAELRHQRRLLLNVATWYLAPLLAAMVIVAATISIHAPTPLSGDRLFQVCYWVFVAFLYWGVWALNHRAVRKQIEPRLEELEKLHRDLLGS